MDYYNETNQNNENNLDYTSSNIENILDNISIDNDDNFNVENEKNQFTIHIQSKIYKLDNRMRYVSYKFEDLKNNFKKYSILIIYLATVLTLIEAYSLSFNMHKVGQDIINFIPLILSSLISLVASIIKFNKYEEKIENITRATEKCIATVAKMKGIKEDIYFCTDEKCLLSLKHHFNKNIYQEYLESNTEIEKQLIDSDYTKYFKRVEKNNIKQEKIKLNKLKSIRLLRSKFNEEINTDSSNNIIKNNVLTNNILTNNVLRDNN